MDYSKCKFSLQRDGSLEIVETLPNPDTGEPMVRKQSITPKQIAAHRRDAELDAALKASADITPAQLASLPAPK